MAILETKHTGSRIEKIKKDLIRVVTAIGCLSMLIFLAYYIYLVTLNFDDVFYLIAYSILIVLILTLFVVELSLKESKKLLKNEKRLVAEKKRKIKKGIKVFKFIVKTALVGLAIYETVTNFDLKISNIANVVSAVILVVQILLEIVVNYIVKQIDYFRLSIELDLNDSHALVQKLIDKIMPMKSLEEDVILTNNLELHSVEERKMIVDIQKEAKKYEKNRTEREKVLKEMLPEPEKKSKFAFLNKIFKK